MALLAATSPPTLNYSEGSTEQTEFLAWTISTNLKIMTDNGHCLPIYPQSFLSWTPTQIEVLLQDVITYAENLHTVVFSNRTAEVPAPLPTFPTLPALPVTGPLASIFKVFVQIALYLAKLWIDRSIKESEATDMSELIETIELLFGQLVPDGQGGTELKSLLERVVQERDIKIDINNGAFTVWPGGLNVDVSEE